MKKSITAVSVLVLLSILLGACNLTQATQTQVPADQINTIAAMTVEALTTQLAPPPATATSPATETPVVTATSTQLIPTLNLTPLSLVTNTLIPLPTTAGVSSTECNKVFFLTDDTIPDNTAIKRGASFAKTWSIQNSGSCTWTSLYMASMFSNDPTDPTINGDGTIPVKVNVAPGAIWKYTANLIAPKKDGTYIQYWKMIDDSGNFFGIGGPSGAGWYVKIKVNESGTSTTNSGGLTLSTSVTLSPTSGSVGDNVTVKGTITLDGLDEDSLDVKFRIQMNGNEMGCGDTMTFNDDGYDTFTLTDCVVPDLSNGDKTIAVYISDPGGSNIATSATYTIE